MLGSGFRESSIVAALRRGARMIGCDSGTTDFRPHLLATGRSHFSRAAVRRDLELILVHRRAAGIPVVVGSAGGAGGDGNLAWLRDILLEIARDRSLHFRLALIRSEQPKQRVHDLLAAGRIEPLAPDGELSEEAIDSAAHIVAMMGVEPIQAGLAEADVVLAGRASDAAIFAAMPLLEGFEQALCWHIGKIRECGAAAVAQRAALDSMMAMLHPDPFDIYPLREDYRCTPQSIASHTLYENVDPFNLHEPSGTLQTQACMYEAISDRAVRVRGSRFAPPSVPGHARGSAPGGLLHHHRRRDPRPADPAPARQLARRASRQPARAPREHCGRRGAPTGSRPVSTGATASWASASPGPGSRGTK
jgi:hypothetical protein